MARTKQYWKESHREHEIEFEDTNNVGIRHYPEAGVIQFLKLWKTDDGKGGFKKDPPVVHLDQMSDDEIENLMAFIMAACNQELDARALEAAIGVPIA